MSDRTLITGFGPFLDVKDNPSSELAKALGRQHRILDVSYDAVEDFIFHLDPDTFDRILMLGVAPGRTHISAELFARNTYGQAPDIRGDRRNGPIQEGEPLLLGTTLFGEDLLSDLLLDTSHFRLSLNAGSYLCNFAYYKGLTAFPAKQVGFLHIPPFSQMGFEDQLRAVGHLVVAAESCFAKV